jgi:hypothetical protein
MTKSFKRSNLRFLHQRFLYLTIFVSLTGFIFACRLVQQGREVVSTLGANRGIQVAKVDDETLDRLALSIGMSGQAKPGDTLQIKVGTNECCYFFQPILADVRWSVDPNAGASIDPHSGVLEIDQLTKNGTVYTVTADVENGRKLLKGTITVFRPEENPLVDVWHEKSPLACEGQEISEGTDILRELVFHADGTFQATFTPFEIYHDYWGNYIYDPLKGTISFQITGGNFIPENLDLEGTYRISDEGSLNLNDIWLGRRESKSKPGCGHIFVK